IGTDGGKFNLSLDGSSILTGIQPNRNSADYGYYSSYNEPLSSSDKDEHSFVFNIYGLKNKNMGIGNIVITGELKTIINQLVGDVNGDGLVNITDVVCLVNYVLTNDATGVIMENTDINDDGDVNITDVVSLVTLILDNE
ncbi:MAG: dockerin type I repeat-containing protein, partial [Prevotella sp.]|nr:dockerin type I repeat-containing protein [Prevotella sp.]